MKFNIHESVKQSSFNSRLGYIVIRDVKVQGTPPSLAQKFFQLQTAIAEAYNIDELVNVPRIVGVRSRLYNKRSFDITRYNTASEELVRRVLYNKDVYYVNSAVAAANYCSIKFLLPIGLYDLDQIDGDITYRLPLEENYVNISGDVVPTNKQPFLSDNNGIFGNSTVDTRRTAVKLSTSNLLAVVYADEKMTTQELTHVLNVTGEKIVRYNSGSIDNKEIV